MGMPLQRMTLAEFMVWENQQQDRHEFYRGEWLNMVGSTRGHNRVVNNLVFRLNIHLDVRHGPPHGRPGADLRSGKRTERQEAGSLGPVPGPRKSVSSAAS
jgi:Uma2 family endonuclease